MHELKPELLLNVRNAKQLSRPGVFETFLASDLDVTDLGAKAFSAYVRNNRGSPDRSSDRAGLTFKCWESEGISVTVRTIYPLTNFRGQFATTTGNPKRYETQQKNSPRRCILEK